MSSKKDDPPRQGRVEEQAQEGRRMFAWWLFLEGGFWSYFMARPVEGLVCVCVKPFSPPLYCAPSRSNGLLENPRAVRSTQQPEPPGWVRSPGSPLGIGVGSLGAAAALP